jgi:CheY-like chemotaxis protein
MLVDDDDIFNILHADLIHQVVPNAKITEFISSKSALIFLTEAIHANTPLPDFLFIDIRMPEMSGLELVEELIKLKLDLFQNTKIYIITSSLDDRDREKSLAYPIVTDFLVKMISQETIEKILIN